MNKIYKKYWLIFISTALFLPLAGCSSGEDKHFSSVIEKFREYEALEARVFDKLVFDKSPKILNRSVELKFLVRDQLGRDWLFKGPETRDGIIAVHRLYNLFGQEDPEAQYKTFIVNGRQLDGTVQRFVTNQGNLRDELFWFFKPAAAQYMARSHVLDWLAANHQVWYEQFLVLGDGGNEVSDLRRIDNSVIWFLMNSDSLNINYQNPSMHHLSRVGYLYFWRVFLERGFELSLQDVYKWAVFISKFPNAQYMELFKRGLENNLASFSNNGTNDLKNQWWQTPEIVKKAPRREDVPKLLLKRKQNLADDLRRVYSELASLRDEKFDPERNDGVAQVAQALIERLDKKMAQLLADEKALDALPRKTQARMEIPVPLDAYWTLRPIVSIPWQPPKQQDQAFARIEQNLREQMAREPSSEGKRLIQNALVNFAKMKRLREMVWDKKFPFETFRHMMLDLNRYFLDKWEDLDEALMVGAKGKR